MGEMTEQYMSLPVTDAEWHTALADALHMLLRKAELGRVPVSVEEWEAGHRRIDDLRQALRRTD